MPPIAPLIITPLAISPSAMQATPDPIAPSEPNGLIITEILYAVPRAPDGDANRDGATHPTGDEFVELLNRSDAPIDLTGIRLIDQSALRNSQHGALRFEFPACILDPGAVAVIFNGPTPGPVGTSESAPPTTHPDFHNALVFTMGHTGRSRAFRNAGDLVALIMPDGTLAHCIAWGDADASARAITSRAPTVRHRSVARIDDRFVEHPPEPPYSPGRVTDPTPGTTPTPAPTPPPASAPGPAPSSPPVSGPPSPPTDHDALPAHTPMR